MNGRCEKNKEDVSREFFVMIIVAPRAMSLMMLIISTGNVMIALEVVIRLVMLKNQKMVNAEPKSIHVITHTRDQLLSALDLMQHSLSGPVSEI